MNPDEGGREAFVAIVMVLDGRVGEVGVWRGDGVGERILFIFFPVGIACVIEVNVILP